MGTKLTLKSQLSPEKVEELRKLKHLTRDSNAKKEKAEKHDAIRKTFSWLYKKFPQVFNRNAPIPLKIGIEQDLFTYIDQNPQLSKRKIRTALKIYTRSLKYQQCILDNQERFNLAGEASGPIDEKHKLFAEEWIAHNKAQKK